MDKVVVSALTSNQAAFSRLNTRPVRRYAGKPARTLVLVRTIGGRPAAGQVGAKTGHS